MAKITITVEDQPNGALSIELAGDLSNAGTEEETLAQKTASLINSMIIAAQKMTPPPACKN